MDSVQGWNEVGLERHTPDQHISAQKAPPDSPMLLTNRPLMVGQQL